MLGGRVLVACVGLGGLVPPGLALRLGGAEVWA